MWNFERFVDNIALISDDGMQLTYGKLQLENDKLVHFIEKRCLVFSFCSNTIGSVVGYTTFLNCGIVPVLLSVHLEADMLKTLMDTYCPTYLWMPLNVWKENEYLRDFSLVYEAWDYVLIQTACNRSYLIHEELGLLLTTSGSTGSPKFVRQSYKNILTNAEQIVEYLKLDSTERPVTTLPMNYTYGCSIINSHLLVGATILLTDKTLMDRGFWNYIKEHQATSFGGVPYTYEILDKLRFFSMKLPYLRYMTQAGGKLSSELHRRFAEYALEKEKKFIVMYGACEATARMGYLPADKSLEKHGSMGIAIPGGKFTLVDADEHVIDEPEVVGELVYEGANVTMGYSECGEDLIIGDVRHGVLYTGDMAKRDVDGFYFIVGRKKRFLKIFGNRVNLDEIDHLIKEKFNYMDCASTGEDDHMDIFITEKPIIDEVRRFISEKTRLNPTAFQVLYIEKVPRSDSGKILYKILELYNKKR